MTWYYDAGGGQRQGPISDAEMDRLISIGMITPETLVWKEGMGEWAPLSRARPAGAQPVFPATTGAAAPLPGTERCDACGGWFAPSELVKIQDRNICSGCKPAVVQQLQQGAELPSVLALDRTGPAWERRRELGLVKAAWETAKEVLLNPTLTFERMKREGGLGGPLLFNVLLGTIGGVASVIYQALMGAGTQGLTGGASEAAMTAGMTAGMTLTFSILMPVFIVIGAFLYAGILHLSLMVCGGAKQPFETTFRVGNYTSGAAGLLQVVPILGSFVAGVWWLICLCIGIARAHEITTGRAVIAVLLPTVVCCVAIFGIIGATMGMAMAMQGQQAP